MYKLIIKLMFVTALAQFGLSLAKVEKCHSRSYFIEIDKAFRQVSDIHWKPISVFPEEAKRFK